REICSGFGRPRMIRSKASALDGAPPSEAFGELVPVANRVLPGPSAEETHVVVLPGVEVEQAGRRVLHDGAELVHGLELGLVALRQLARPREEAALLGLVVALPLREVLQ